VSLAVNPPPSRIESEVRRIRGLLDGKRFTEAIAACRALRQEVPENRDVLYMLAVSQRYSDLIQDALVTLSELESVHPGYSRLFQERGHCYVQLHDLDAALQSFARAVSLNAALPATWLALHLLLRTAGQGAEAQKALAQLRQLERLPPPVVTAASMLADGDTVAADHLIRHFLKTHPDQVDALSLKAQMHASAEAHGGAPGEADQLYERVLKLDPSRHDARYELVLLMLKTHRHAKALAQARLLLEAEPKDRRYRTVYAAACIAVGQPAEGLEMYGSLIAEDPQAAELYLAIGDVHKTEGHQQLAVESYRAATVIRRSFGQAYWGLANLKTYRFTDDEIARMQHAEADPAAATADRIPLCFALGKGFEDRGDYQQSFLCYARGNALKRAEVHYQQVTTDRNAKLQAEVCTRDFFTARQGVGCERNDPIFIVGLPRAGSTLIEQILASHSLVEGTWELSEIPLLVHSLQAMNVDATNGGAVNGDAAEPRFPEVLLDLQPEDFRRFGEKYLAGTQAYRTGRRFFIDKMPNNFRHLGLIHLMLPNAKIIDARREAMACCFSNFKQLYAVGQEFTYSLADIAHYYRRYVDLMDHWNEVLPGKILRIQHEELVADLEGNVRRLLEFCGLGFEDACLRFHENKRSVRTASSEQVRQPLNPKGLTQWRHFEPWLGPLRQALTL
jgi:tetratricopeptide (TPR) repeat protein